MTTDKVVRQQFSYDHSMNMWLCHNPRNINNLALLLTPHSRPLKMKAAFTVFSCLLMSAEPFETNEFMVMGPRLWGCIASYTAAQAALPRPHEISKATTSSKVVNIATYLVLSNFCCTDNRDMHIHLPPHTATQRNYVPLKVNDIFLAHCVGRDLFN